MKIYTIYRATNTLTNKSYIGFSSDWKSRRREHKFNALNGDNRNYVFYNSIRKYGFDTFEWEVLYQSKEKQHTLEVMEDFFITECNTIHPYGYNMKTGGGGGNLSEYSRNKISERRKGMKFSESHLENLRLSHLGKNLPSEQRKKISESLTNTLKNSPPVVCPHCGKSGRKSTMTRFHFNNCRSSNNYVYK